jgi:hypothetical protein
MLHSQIGLCIVSTYRSFAGKDTRLDTFFKSGILFYVGITPGTAFCSNFFVVLYFEYPYDKPQAPSMAGTMFFTDS